MKHRITQKQARAIATLAQRRQEAAIAEAAYVAAIVDGTKLEKVREYTVGEDSKGPFIEFKRSNANTNTYEHKKQS